MIARPLSGSLYYAAVLGLGILSSLLFMFAPDIAAVLSATNKQTDPEYIKICLLGYKILMNMNFPKILYLDFFKNYLDCKSNYFFAFEVKASLFLYIFTYKFSFIHF